MVSEKLEAAMPGLNLDPATVSSRRGEKGSSVASSSQTNTVLPPGEGLSEGTSLSFQDEDEETATRRALRPPPIEGLEDWGIPSESSDPCDPDLEAKVIKFHLLKRQGKHFNDSLMQSKAFRNPHIYAKLVQFVDVNETATNFPKDVWDPFDVKEEWYADKIAAKQKERYEKSAASQAPGQRSRIAFESASQSVEPSSSSKEKDVRRYHPYGKSEEERSQASDSHRDSRWDHSRGRHESRHYSEKRR